MNFPHPPGNFGYGVSCYAAVWPLIDSPLDLFQIGLPSTWIIPDNDDSPEVSDERNTELLLSRDFFAGLGIRRHATPARTGHWGSFNSAIVCLSRRTGSHFSRGSMARCWVSPGWPFLS